MRKFFNSFVFIPIRSLADARDDTIFGNHGGRERAASRVRITTDPAISIGSPFFASPLYARQRCHPEFLFKKFAHPVL
jgi:hypothetical protein